MKMKGRYIYCNTYFITEMEYLTMMSEVIQWWLIRMSTLQHFLNQKMSLVVYIRDVINRFVQAGSVNKVKSSGRLPQSEQAVED
jgi:hypothetical protein